MVMGALARLAAAVVAGTALQAVAAPPALTLRPVASGLSQPVEITHAGDSSGRIFVVERGGRIRVVRNGALLEAPFLDIGARVRTTGGEQGLLGLAFHPLYAANRRFYVFYTAPAPAPDANGSLLVVSEFLASPGDPDAADEGSERIVISIPHPGAGNHNGGRIAFGPDGYLYIAVGDGGGGGDQSNNAQNRHVLLGKLLRIDVNTHSGYAIPLTNPFVGHDGVDQIWAYGLRNPWKFSFDRATGDLFIADVGQNAWEEVNFEPAGDAGGRNYGWRVMEGNHCFPSTTSVCDQSGKVLPILEYGRGEGFSIIGGYVYRGRKSRALRGYYVFGDLGGPIWAAAAGEGWSRAVVADAVGSLSTFGEDESGELYAASINGDTLYALDGPGPNVPTPSDFDGDGRSDVLWRNSSTGENYLYPMNGRAIQGGEGYLRTVAIADWHVAGVGDFDGDGKADILWRNGSTGQNYIYPMDGRTIKPGEGFIRTVALAWAVAGVADFDGDGKADILWRNASTGENYLYLMDGLAIKPSEGYVRTVALEWGVAGVGDFDGDDKADILWRNASTGQNYIYPMDGRTIKPGESFIRTVPLAWGVAGIGDFDGDGKGDLLWRNTNTGENYIYPMDGPTIRPGEGSIRTVALAWNVVAVGDFDGDGKSDILWRSGTNGENYLYPMNGRSIRPTEGNIRTVVDLQWSVTSR